MFDWLDSLTGANRSKRNVKKLKEQPTGTHTFYLAAPLCAPIRRIYTALYDRGVRPVSHSYGEVQYRNAKDDKLVTLAQEMTLTVRNGQANWTEYLLQHLKEQDREGFEIHSRTIDVRNSFHAKRRQGKMPIPWKAQSCK